MPDDMIRGQGAVGMPEEGMEAVGLGGKLGSWFFNRGKQRGFLASLLKFIGERLLKSYGDKQQQELIREIDRIRKDKAYTPEQKENMIASLQKGITDIEGLKTLPQQDKGDRMVEIPADVRETQMNAALEEPLQNMNQHAVNLQRDFDKIHEEISGKKLKAEQQRIVDDAKTNFNTAKDQFTEIQRQIPGSDFYGKQDLVVQSGEKLDAMKNAKDSLAKLAEKLKKIQKNLNT